MKTRQKAKLKPPRSPFTFIWVLLSIALGTSAAMFSKKAALVGKGFGLWSSLLTPWYLGTLISLGLLACIWVMALRNYPLSYVYPLMSTQRGFILLGAWILFHETILFQEILGILIIIAGIALVGRTAKR